MASNLFSRRRFLVAASGAAVLTAGGKASINASIAANISTVDDSIAANLLPASTEEIIRAAAKEGSVDLRLGAYGDDVIKVHIENFRKRYPWLQVTFNTSSTAQAYQRFNAELGAKKGISDFWCLGTPVEANQWAAQGAFADFKVSEDAGYLDYHVGPSM